MTVPEPTAAREVRICKPTFANIREFWQLEGSDVADDTAFEHLKVQHEDLITTLAPRSSY